MKRGFLIKTKNKYRLNKKGLEFVNIIRNAKMELENYSSFATTKRK